MLKVFITLNLVVALSYITVAQQAFPRFQAKALTIGATAVGDSISATCIDLSPFTVANYTYDSASQLLYLDMVTTQINGRLDDRNYYTCFDLKQKKVIWNSSFKHYSPSAFFIGNNIARHMGAFCGIYNAQTRELLGKDPEDWIVYADQEHRFFLSQNGMAIDGNTLNELWDVDINAKYGWSDFRYQGRDTILIVANGLYAIDVRSGKGWQHKLKTGTDKYRNMLALNAIGVTAALFTGVGVYGGSPDKVSGMCSNLLDASDGWYLAGSNAVIKVAKDGSLRWMSDLPVNHSGQSKIWRQGDSLFVLNKGYAFKANKVISVDKPYLAAYNGKDGKLIYNKPIPGSGIVNDICQKDGKLFLRFEKEISVIDLQSGADVKNAQTVDSMADYREWIDASDIAIGNGNEAVHAYSPQKDELLLLNTRNSNIIRVNNDLSRIGYMAWGTYYMTKYYDGYKLRTKGDRMLIYDGRDRKADINTGFRPSFRTESEFVILHDSKLCFFTIR